MHILAIVFGLLLLVFGGGCTLVVVGSLLSDPGSMLSDLPLLLSIVVPLGILPAIGGWFLFRWGLKIDRQKRRQPPPTEG